VDGSCTSGQVRDGGLCFCCYLGNWFCCRERKGGKRVRDGGGGEERREVGGME
jgi:hypothetical protein